MRPRRVPSSPECSLLQPAVRSAGLQSPSPSAQRSRCGARHRQVLAGAWLLAALSNACRAAPDPAATEHLPARPVPEAEPPTATERTEAEASSSVRAKMTTHHDEAQTMRWAITIGDLETLKAIASQLASDRWLPALSSEWAAPLAELRAAASRASEVDSVETGAAALAAVGSACAACHLKLGGRSKAMALSPPAGAQVPSMLNHQAAVDELWLGLSTPDPDAWQRGARALASGSFAAGSASAELAAHEIVALARQSIDAPSEQREALLAKSLSTCAHCHLLHGIGVASTREAVRR